LVPRARTPRAEACQQRLQTTCKPRLSLGAPCAHCAAPRSVLSAHRLAAQMGEAAAELLVPAPRLRRLSLFDNALGDAGAGRLADALAAAAHTSLLELDLAGTGIGAAGVARLFAVLEGGAAPALEARLPR